MADRAEANFTPPPPVVGPELLRAAFDQALTGIVLGDLQGRIIEANAAFCKLVGRSLDELIGRDSSLYTHPDDVSQNVQKVQHLNADPDAEAVYEKRYIRPSGDIVWGQVSVRVLRGPDGQPQYLIVGVEDVTERHTTQAKLRETAEQRRLAMDLAELGWWRLDLSTGLFDFDDRFRTIFGFTQDVMTNDIFRRTIVHPDDLPRIDVQSASSFDPNVRSRFDSEYRIFHPDGSVHWVHVNGKFEFSGPGPDAKAVRVIGAAADITAQRQAELALRDSQDRLSLALSIAQMGTFEIDLRTDAVTVNADGRSIYGWADNETLTFSKVQTHFHPADKESVIAAVGASMDPAGSRQFKVEQRIIRTDGVVRWIRVWGRTMFTGDTPSRCVGTYIDITEEKETANLLRDSVLRFRQLADSMPQIVFTAEPSGNVDYFNRRWYEYTGIPEDADTSAAVWSQVHEPDALPRVTARWMQAVESGEGYEIEYRLRRHDGQWRWHLGRALPVRDAAGQIVRWFGTNTDIHDQKTASDALRISEDRYRLATRATNNAIWDWNLQNNSVLWNEAVESAFGYETDEVEKTAAWWIEHIHPDDRGRVSDSIHDVIDDPTRDKWQAEYRFLRGDGSYADVFDRGYVLRNAAGHGVRMIGAMQDLTDTKKIERQREQLLQAERAAREEAERTSQMKDEFLATLSHELRTPLNAILGWSQIIQGKASAEDLAQGLSVIERNARSQSKIIDDLLDMSQIISGKVRLDVRAVDLPAVLHAAIESARPAAVARGIRLQAVIDPGAGPISGDANRLQQVFWNLLTNAVKFTGRGGQVRVVLQRVESHVEAVVTDTGEGIAPSFLPHVFDRFRQADATTTRRHGGLGLGLSIVKQIIELHGGMVFARSPGLGLGATFLVHLPLPATARSAAPSNPSLPAVTGTVELPDDISLSGVRVLVVDDEADARSYVRKLLENCGATVATASNVNDAVHCVAREPFNVLVSDIGMPDEDGYSLIRRVRLLPDAAGRIPALALTAYAHADDRVRAVRAGYQMHVAKPAEPAELLAMVASLAGRTGNAS